MHRAARSAALYGSCLIACRDLASLAKLEQTVWIPVMWVQTAALLEIVHAAVSLVRASPMITAIQGMYAASHGSLALAPLITASPRIVVACSACSGVAPAAGVGRVLEV